MTDLQNAITTVMNARSCLDYIFCNDGNAYVQSASIAHRFYII